MLEPKASPEGEPKETSKSSLKDSITPEVMLGAINRLGDLLQSYVEAKKSTTGRTGKHYFILAIIMSILVVVPVSLLVWAGKLSTDAGAFLFGVIVAGILSIIRDFFMTTNDD